MSNPNKSILDLLNVVKEALAEMDSNQANGNGFLIGNHMRLKLELVFGPFLDSLLADKSELDLEKNSD